MNFKDKAYYTNKAKDCLGLLLTTAAFDAILLLSFLMA